MKLNRLVYALLLALIVHGFSLAQEREVKGTVRDSNGLEMLGVAVVVKGEAHGTETNLDGKYTIRVADGKTLEFSFLGMKTKRFKVNGQGRIDVVMEEEAQAIDEVVVVGYGSGRKVGTVVGSVTHIGGKEIANRPSSSAVDALQGKVPGLQILSSSGEPSSVASIRLYGVGSLGSSSSSPLFVVDGIPITDAAVRSLNQADFESISVLKDASATSIYGSRASNGVVYITTKRGKNNTKGEITVHTQYGLSNLADRSAFERMMNADELAKFWVAAGLKTQAQMDKIRRENPYDTRWDKVYFQEDIPVMQTDISVAGGNEKSRYYVSGGYYNQKGLMYRSGFERYNLRSNVDSRVNDWLKIGLNASLAYYEIQTNQFTGANLNGGMSMLLAPFYSPVDKNGNRLDYIEGLGAYHPNYLAEKMPAATMGVELIPTGFVEITPFKGFTFKSQGGIQYRDLIIEANRLPSYQGAYLKGTVSKEYSKVLQKTLTNTFEYKFSFNKVHNFVALLGQETLSLFTHSFNASGQSLIDDSLLLLSHATSNKTIGESKSKSTMNSLFGRVEYDYNSKYFLDFSLRRDGSSKFSPNHKYGNFWAAGAMWKLKKEKFLEDSKLVNDLSVKFSVGTSGNSDIGDYTHQALAGSSQYGGATSWAISAAGNPDLTWEKQTKYTFSVDSRLFNDRLNANVEFYRRITTDMLMDVPVPYTTSFETIKKNVGKLQNQGINIALSGDVYRNKERKIAVTPYINFGYNQDKVLELFQGRKSWFLPDRNIGI
ncbi:SusC/RagA family TonB-linked outer membrane protein [Capnocytophaga leadbetteri]